MLWHFSCNEKSRQADILLIGYGSGGWRAPQWVHSCRGQVITLIIVYLPTVLPALTALPGAERLLVGLTVIRPVKRSRSFVWIYLFAYTKCKAWKPLTEKLHNCWITGGQIDGMATSRGHYSCFFHDRNMFVHIRTDLMFIDILLL